MSFGTTSQFVNGTTSYYDLSTPLQGLRLETTGFSPQATQYNQKGTYFVSKSNVNTSGFSTDDTTVYSTGGSYYDVGGNNGSPPSIVPSPPELNGNPTSSSIPVYFNTNGESGDPLATYYILYGLTNPPKTQLTVNRSFGTLYTANATGLEGLYYFQSVATNSFGTKLSDISSFSTAPLPPSPTPPSASPTIPSLVSRTSTSITVQFDATGITGNPTPTFYAECNGLQIPTTFVSGLYQGTATGLQPSTSYNFTSVATNPSGTTRSSAVPFSTSGSSTKLDTTCMVTFLVNGPNIYQTNNYVNWYVNSDNSPVYGDNYLTSQPGQPSNIAGTMAFSTSGASATPQSGNYIAGLQAKGIKVCVSVGGYYYDMLGSINSVQKANDFMQTVCYVLLGLGDSSWNKLGWNSAGFVTSSGSRVYFDGLNLDFENIGQGGNPNRSSGSGNLPAVPLPASPAVPDSGPYPSPQYDYMINTCAAICSAWGTYGSPTKKFSMAPLSPATTLMTKNTAPTTALGNYQAFPTSTSGISTYNAGSGLGLQAQIHPTQLKFFDEVFVQMYNETPDYLPGGSSFTTILTQWGYLCKKAQDLGGKTKVILGFATQDIQLGVVWNPSTDPAFVNTALSDSNTALATQYPGIQISDWCSGIGFWASPSGTTTLITEYGKASTSIPNLPNVGNAMVWADADYVLSALDPLWTSLPVVYG